MLSIFIKISDIEHMNVFNNKLLISHLADDTTLFLKNLEQVPKAIQSIEFFSTAAGLKLNLKEYELLAIHSCSHLPTYSIPIKTSVKYLFKIKWLKSFLVNQ